MYKPLSVCHETGDPRAREGIPQGRPKGKEEHPTQVTHVHRGPHRLGGHRRAEAHHLVAVVGNQVLRNDTLHQTGVPRRLSFAKVVQKKGGGGCEYGCEPDKKAQPGWIIHGNIETPKHTTDQVSFHDTNVPSIPPKARTRNNIPRTSDKMTRLRPKHRSTQHAYHDAKATGEKHHVVDPLLKHRLRKHR